MTTLAYSLSPTLKELLAKIDNERKQILAVNVTPSTIYQLRWQANLDRIHLALKLLGIDKDVVEIEHILSTYLGLKKIPPAPRQLVHYKMALDHIWQTWSGSNKVVSIKDLAELASVMEVRLENKLETERVLGYMQSENVHPVIQAAISHLPQANTPLAYLVPLIFLDKGGFNLHGMFSLERQWVKRQQEYRDLIKATENAVSLTLWLEFFAQTLAYELEDLRIQLNRPHTLPSSPKILALSTRQRAILALFDQPYASITNKKIQEVFKVSQITASRDLSKLALLGLIFAHGGGRSVYYTKI